MSARAVLGTVLTAFIAVPLLGIPAYPATIRVPGDQPTIQAGIDAASESDTVLVAPGTYTGPGNEGIQPGKDVVVLARDGPDATTIRPFRVAFELVNRETLDCVVDGFTIIDTQAFYLIVSAITVRNCVIRGGLNVQVYFQSQIVMTDCQFIDNLSGGGGGAISVSFDSSALVERCTMIGNGTHSFGRGGAVEVLDDGELIMRDCLLAGNWAAALGGGVYVSSNATASISGCTIANNCAGEIGGGFYVDGTAEIENSIIAFNRELFEPSPDCGPGSVQISCSNVYGNTGGDYVDCIDGLLGVSGNISEDPLFCLPAPDQCYPDVNSVQYALRDGSPCAPENSDGCGLIGALPVACVATTLQPSTWGSIKAMYGELGR